MLSIEALMAVMFQGRVFWVVMTCNVVVGHQHLRGPYYFHLHPWLCM